MSHDNMSFINQTWIPFLILCVCVCACVFHGILFLLVVATPMFHHDKSAAFRAQLL